MDARARCNVDHPLPCLTGRWQNWVRTPPRAIAPGSHPGIRRDRFLVRPKEKRHKMDPRWRIGAFLGRSWNYDENFVVLPSGDVTRARAWVRVVESKRRQLQRLENVRVTRGMNTHAKTDAIERDALPHRGLQLDTDHAEYGPDAAAQHGARRLKLFHEHLLKHGYRDNGAKCNLYRIG